MEDVFCERLKEARKHRNYTQAYVASQLDVSKSAYCLYENGIRRPSIKLLKKIAQILQISADWLLGLDDSDFDFEEIGMEREQFTEKQVEEIRIYAEYVKSRGGKAI